ncbi:single-stranded DNA-binding protein, partial [Aneurinibacillus thermoaerophilus]|nr:single-stranded DNA-binding protein [Aneurinibacillus thermoaerophilus]
RRVYVTEIVAENVQFLGGGQKNQGQGTSGNVGDKGGNPYGLPFGRESEWNDISDDDLPF